MQARYVRQERSGTGQANSISIATGDGQLPRTLFGDENIFGVEEVAVVAFANAVDDAGLQICQQGSRDVVIIVSLVKEHVLAVRPFNREVLERTVGSNSMFGAQLFPELHPDLVATLAHLHRHDLARHVGLKVSRSLPVKF